MCHEDTLHSIVKTANILSFLNDKNSNYVIWFKLIHLKLLDKFPTGKRKKQKTGEKLEQLKKITSSLQLQMFTRLLRFFALL